MYFQFHESCETVVVYFKSSDSETSFTQQNVASLFQNGNGMDVPETEETVIRRQRKKTK